MGKQSHFELGMTVHDRHDPSPDDAVVVNLPDIPINEFVVYHNEGEEVTVANNNPGYDPQQKVVIVVYQKDLDVFGGEYTGEYPITFDALSRNNIPYYAFPPERLVPDDLRYNTDPPESVGTPLISEKQFIQRDQMELVIIDRVASGTNNRIAKTGAGDEINVGPVPADSGESVYVIRLKNSNSHNDTKFGFCVIILEAGSVGGFSATNYIESMMSLTQLSASTLKQQLSDAIDINNSNSLIEYFNSVKTRNLTPSLDECDENLSKISQLLDSSETITGEIDRISSSGNGIVDTDGREINIGPVANGTIGTTVDVRPVHSNLGECLDESVRAPDYEKEWILKKLVEGTPPPGTEFKIEIDYVNDNGNGMADLGDRTINLGTIRRKAVGQTVPVKMLDNTFAKCLDFSARTSSYKFPGPMSEKYVPKPGGIFSDVIESVNDSGKGVIIAGCRRVNVGPVRSNSLGKRVRVEMINHQFGKCLTQEVRGENYQEWLKERGVDTEAKHEEGSDKQHNSKESDVKVNPQSVTSSSKSREPNDNNDEEIAVAALPEIEVTQELQELRQEAEEAATDNPVRENVETSSSQYRRSSKIKEYAMARAQGNCEFCGDPAPFVKPNDDPYLEEHHVDELGDGGADDPSLVAALCPECHREIHHGRHGPELNQKLREKLEAGLGDVGATE